MARYIAKNIVHAGLTDSCIIQISYAIGISKPLSVYVKTSKNSKINNSDIVDFINKNIDLTPKGIRNTLKLNNPIYKQTASFGHFGREFSKKDNMFLWEECNLENDLKKWFGVNNI